MIYQLIRMLLEIIAGNLVKYLVERPKQVAAQSYSNLPIVTSSNILDKYKGII